MSKSARWVLALVMWIAFAGACSDEGSQTGGQLQGGVGGAVAPIAGVSEAPLPAAGAPGAGASAIAGTGAAGMPAAAAGTGVAGMSAAGAAGLPVAGATGMPAAGSGGGGPAAGAAAAGSSGGGPCGTESFAAIYRDIFMNTVYACGSAACHGRVSALPSVGNLDLSTPAAAYAGLVGKTSDSDVCAGKPRVVAGSPDASMLVDKLREATVDCGNIMPLGSDPITDDEFMRIIRWIQGGACNN